MQKYFGPLRNSDIDTFASDAFAHETHNLPRAYVGRNKFLMATIDFLITKDDDWYTRHVLPWLYTEELHVKWNIWRFNKTMMDYEPEQGVPRYVSYESESRSDSLVRRGLAFIIEHGFYKTELGRQHYLMNLKQIVEAVHETVYFGVMHELLASPNFYTQWQRNHGNQPSLMHNDAVSALAEERWRFACVQKDVKGLFILDAEIKDRMRRKGIEPDSWIFPSKMAIYASMVPEYFNEFIRAGDKATTALENGAKRFDTFRGSRVFETRPFDTDFMTEDAIEPLMRNRQIGEYYLMNSNEDLRIFDMARDKFHPIGHKDAVRHCWQRPVDARAGTNLAQEDIVDLLCQDLTDRAIPVTVEDLIDNGLNYDRVHDIAIGAPPPGSYRTPCQYGAALAPLGQTGAGAQPPERTRIPLSDDAAKGITGIRALIREIMEDENVLIIPHKMLLLRPRMTYRMGTAVLLKGGDELGSTLHGHHDFQLTDDVIHKTHIGHYTFYSKSVVREPKNMYLAEDVYCSGYVGGENTEFLDQVDASKYGSEVVSVQSKSLIAVPVAPDFEPAACLALTGDLERHGLSSRNGVEGNYTTSHVVSHELAEYMDEEADLGIGEMQKNGICFRGAEHTRRHANLTDAQVTAQTVGGAVALGAARTARFANIASRRQASNLREYVQTQQNTGHWGPSVYDGCASVRQGMYSHLRHPGSSTAVGYT